MVLDGPGADGDSRDAVAVPGSGAVEGASRCGDSGRADCTRSSGAMAVVGLGADGGQGWIVAPACSHSEQTRM